MDVLWLEMPMTLREKTLIVDALECFAGYIMADGSKAASVRAGEAAEAFQLYKRVAEAALCARYEK